MVGFSARFSNLDLISHLSDTDRCELLVQISKLTWCTSVRAQAPWRSPTTSKAGLAPKQALAWTLRNGTRGIPEPDRAEARASAANDDAENRAW